MKSKIILFTCLITSCFSSFGQVRFTPQDPYAVYSVGLNLGYTTMYGDLKQSNPKYALIGNVSRHMTSYIILGIELQHGILSSTEPSNHWTTGLGMTNQFTAANINGKMTLGQLLQNPHNVALKTLSNVYIGAGVGFIDNDITDITNKFKPADPTTINEYIKKSSIALVVPLNLGINFYLKHFFGYKNGAQFNINYQWNASNSDYIDGYSFSSATAKNKHNDVYSILSLGFTLFIPQKN